MADPGFPVGGGVHPLGGRGPPTRALFGENVCENKRIGSHRGLHVPGMPLLDPPMKVNFENEQINDIMREQWHYNSGHQEIATSIHFVNINTEFWQNLLGFEPSPAGPS